MSGMVDENLSSKVEIFLGCRNLPKIDYISRTDAKIFLYLRDNRNSNEVLLGGTETAKNMQNPDFETTFTVEYFFEENQELIARVFQSGDDKQQYSVDSRNFIGSGSFTIGDIVGAKGLYKTTNLRNRLDQEVKNFTGIQIAQVVARCDEVSGVNETAKITITGLDMDAKGTCCCCMRSSNPYFEISKTRPGGDEGMQLWQKVFTSPISYQTLNPRFATFSMRRQTLCNSDNKTELMFKVWHKSSIGLPKLIGQGKTNFKQMLTMVNGHDEARKLMQKSNTKLNLKGMMLPLINPDMAISKGKRYKNSGVLLFNRIEVQEEASFLDFIQGGLNLKLMVAIDFTASNSEPTNPISNHYIDPTRRTMNKYEKAIEAIGTIVVPYDSDQMISVWGFGAKLLETQKVSHCFPLTFNTESDEVKGVAGILEAYRKCFSRIDLSGPTLLGDVLSAANQIASLPFTQSTQHYSLLLILTDGVVNDMKATIHRIVKMSTKPISVIIIGIGDTDFSDMRVLDADSGELASKKLAAVRDIVQFVPMNLYRDSDMNRLSAEVLSEIPAQLLSFMKLRNVRPMMKRKISPLKKGGRSSLMRVVSSREGGSKTRETTYQPDDVQGGSNEDSDE